MFRKRVWIPIVILLLAVIGCGLFYGRQVSKQAPVTIIKPVDVSETPATPKPPPPGETAESGHWHGEEWHSQPHDTHAPVEVSEVDAELATPPAERPEVQGTPVGAPPINAQSPVSVQELSKGSPEAREAIKTWRAWSEKADEIRSEISAVAKEHSDAMALTEAEAERYETDENVQRKVALRINAVTEKLNDVYRRQREHEEKRPPFPRVQ